MDEFSDLGSWEACPLSGVFWPAGGLSLRGTWGQRRGFSTRPGLKKEPQGGRGGPGHSCLVPTPRILRGQPRSGPRGPWADQEGAGTAGAPTQNIRGNSPAVHALGLGIFSATDSGSIPDLRTKIPQAAQRRQKKKKVKKETGHPPWVGV